MALCCFDRYKLVVSSEDDPWLFDLDKDPDELVNRVGDPALNETLRTFAEGIQRYCKSTMTLTVRIRKFRRVSQRYLEIKSRKSQKHPVRTIFACNLSLILNANQSNMNNLSRRKILKTSAATLSFSVLPSYLVTGKPSPDGKLPPSKRINLGVIGCGGRANGVVPGVCRDGKAQSPHGATWISSAPGSRRMQPSA